MKVIDSAIKDSKWNRNVLVKAFKLYGNAIGREAEDWADDVVRFGPDDIDELNYFMNHQATIIPGDKMKKVIEYLKQI